MKQSGMYLGLVLMLAAVVTGAPSGLARTRAQTAAILRQQRAQAAALRRQQQQLRQQQQQTAKQQQQIQTQQAQQQKKQEDQGAAKWQADTLAEYDRTVDLTTDQKAQIRPILASLAKQVETADMNTKLTPAQHQAEAQKVFDSVYSKVSPVLTTQQTEKYSRAKLLARLDKVLDLTDAQKTKIKSIQAEEITQRQAARDDGKLTQPERVTHIQEAEDTAWSSIDEVLTPAQQKKLDKFRVDDTVAHLESTITMDAATKASVVDVLNKAAIKARTIRADKALTPQARTVKLKEVTDRMWVQMREQLPLEQRGSLDAIQTSLKTQAANDAKPSTRAKV